MFPSESNKCVLPLLRAQVEMAINKNYINKLLKVLKQTIRALPKYTNVIFCDLYIFVSGSVSGVLFCFIY